jgi:uncharacterized protein DUF4271
MNDSIPYYFNVVGVSKISADTIVANSDSGINASYNRFLELTSVNIDPLPIFSNFSDDIITYILFFLIGTIAMIWHFLPDKFALIFSLKIDNQFARSGDRNVRVPGTLITGFFWINFIIVSCFFILILLEKYFAELIISMSVFEVFGVILIGFLCLIVYRSIVIYATGIVFQTKKMMKKQLVIGRNIQFITGVILAPIVLLIIYSSGSLLLSLMALTIAFLQVLRLVKISIIGKSSTIFSTLHIILYLCALELVPILVLFGLIGNDSVM